MLFLVMVGQAQFTKESQGSQCMECRLARFVLGGLFLVEPQLRQLAVAM